MSPWQNFYVINPTENKLLLRPEVVHFKVDSIIYLHTHKMYQICIFYYF